MNNILNAEKLRLKINLDSGAELEINRGGFVSYSLENFSGTFNVSLDITAFLPVKEGDDEKTKLVHSGEKFDVAAGTLKTVVITGTIKDDDDNSIRFHESSTEIKTVATGSFLYRIQRADDEEGAKDFHVHQVGETLQPKSDSNDGTFKVSLAKDAVSEEFIDENTRDILVTITEPNSLVPIATFALADKQINGQVFLSTFPGTKIAGNPFMLTQATTTTDSSSSETVGVLPPQNKQRDTHSRTINLINGSSFDIAYTNTDTGASNTSSAAITFEESFPANDIDEMKFKLSPVNFVSATGTPAISVGIQELVGVTNNVHYVILSSVNPDTRVIPDVKQGIYETSKVTVINRLSGTVEGEDLASVDVYFVNTDILPLFETKDLTADSSTVRSAIQSTNFKPGEYFIHLYKPVNNVRQALMAKAAGPFSLGKEKNYHVYLYNGSTPNDVRIKVIEINPD
ncbi:hypothetical protein [Algicola sagamiensis]|uniref:hypothetical protein n=1 Tax=Algicola sagamiensis TaxID=163869 RepID=UPI0012F91B5C|nr:hypothetical protein [Algicola sagamiensis]